MARMPWLIGLFVMGGVMAGCASQPASPARHPAFQPVQVPSSGTPKMSPVDANVWLHVQAFELPAAAANEILADVESETPRRVTNLEWVELFRRVETHPDTFAYPKAGDVVTRKRAGQIEWHRETEYTKDVRAEANGGDAVRLVPVTGTLGETIRLTARIPDDEGWPTAVEMFIEQRTADRPFGAVTPADQPVPSASAVTVDVPQLTFRRRHATVFVNNFSVLASFEFQRESAERPGTFEARRIVFFICPYADYPVVAR